MLAPPLNSFSDPRVFTSQRKEEREVTSFVKIYAVFSDDVMVRLCALLRRTRVATVLKALHKLQHLTRPGQPSLLAHFAM